MTAHPRFTRPLAWSVATVVLAVLLSSVALVAASRSSATPAAPRCFAVIVDGRTTQQARAMLLARGCKPGSVKDGRHFLVVKACHPAADFGRVFWQSVRNRRLGPRERLVLRVGIRRRPDGRICGQFNPDTGPPASPADWNGTYDASLTVSDSNTPLARIGQEITGLSFTAVGGELQGDITGNVNAAGRSKNAVANIVGLACKGTLTFSDSGSVITVAGSATCVSGSVTVKGNIRGRRAAGLDYGFVARR